MALPSEDAHRCGLDDYIIKSLYFVAYKRGCLFPQSLASNTRYGKMFVLPDGTTATDVRSNSQEPLQPVVLRADYPIPIYCSVYYFEVTIHVKSRSGVLTVGVCSSRSSLSQWPGMETNSYGYRSNNGAIYHNADELFATGLPYGESDVIGCGINFVNNSIFFTKNGVFMGPITAGKKLPHPVYPCIALASLNCRVSANFGRHKFIFDIGQYVARERAVVVSMAVERKCNDLLAHVTMRNLVASYLLHNGYLETTSTLGKWYRMAEDCIPSQEPANLRANTENTGHQRSRRSYSEADSAANPTSAPSTHPPVSANSDAGFNGHPMAVAREAQQKTEFQHLFSWPEPSHLLIQRRLLMETIRMGDYLRAVKLLEENFPSLTEQDPSIAFVLRCHHFIDQICRQQHQPVARSAPPTGVSRPSMPETVRRRHSFVHCPSPIQSSSSLPDYSSLGSVNHSCQSLSHQFPLGGESHVPTSCDASVAKPHCQAHEHSPTTCQAPMRLRLDGPDEDGQSNGCQPSASPKPLPVFPAHQPCYSPRSEVGFQHQVILQEGGPVTNRTSNNSSPTPATLYDFSEGQQQLHKPDRLSSHRTTGYDSPNVAMGEACGATLVETGLPSGLGNGVAQHGVGKLVSTAATFFVDPQPTVGMPTNGSSTDNDVHVENNGNSHHDYQQQQQQPFCDHPVVVMVGKPSEPAPTSTDESSVPVQNGNSSFLGQVMVNGAGGGNTHQPGELIDPTVDSSSCPEYTDEVLPAHDVRSYDCPPDELATDDESLLNVVQYGRALRVTALELQSRNCITDTQISLLMGAFGLIAYQDPYTSPFRDFLEPTHRDCLADAVNSAIMVHLDQPASPLLNRMLTFFESALTEGERLSGLRQPFIASSNKLGSNRSGNRFNATAARSTPSTMVTTTVGTGTSNPSSMTTPTGTAAPPPHAGTASDNPTYSSESAATVAPTRSRVATATLAHSNIAASASPSSHRYNRTTLDQQVQSRYANRYQLLPIDIHTSMSPGGFAPVGDWIGRGTRAVNGALLLPQPESVPEAPNSSLYIPPSALVSHGSRVRTVTTEVTAAAAAAALESASRESPFRRSTWTSSPSTPVGHAAASSGSRSRPVSLQNLVDRRATGPEPPSLASASSPSGLTPSTPAMVVTRHDIASFMPAPTSQTYSVSSQTVGEAGAGRSSLLVGSGYHHTSESVGMSTQFGGASGRAVGAAAAAAAAAGGGADSSRTSTIVPDTAYLAVANTQAPTGPELANFFHPILFTGD